MTWSELIAIKEEARKLRAEDRDKPIVDCPLCGEVLEENKRGVLNCPMGHFSQRGKRRGAESV